MRRAASLLASACLAATPALGVELDETLLGLDHVTLKVGQAVTPESAAELKDLGCWSGRETSVFCPIPAPGKRGIGYIITDDGDGPRIGAVISYWRCEPSQCPQSLSDTVDELSRKLGAKPEQVDGAATWKDRNGPPRELAVAMMDTNVIAVSLSSK